MTFITESGRKVSLFVTDPREDIVSAKEAKIVQTEVTEFDLVV